MVNSTHQHIGSWYTRIPAADRRVITAMADWLRPINWQLFATLTFPVPRRLETAQSDLKRFVNELEREIRRNICYVAGAERIPGPAGFEVSWHFHLMIASVHELPALQVERAWRRMFGPGKKTLEHPDGDSAVVYPFKPGKLGIEYCLKRMNDCHGDWMSHRLELFHPCAPKSANHKIRRQFWRMQQTESSVAWVGSGHSASN